MIRFNLPIRLTLGIILLSFTLLVCLTRAEQPAEQSLNLFFSGNVFGELESCG